MDEENQICEKCGAVCVLGEEHECTTETPVQQEPQEEPASVEETSSEESETTEETPTEETVEEGPEMSEEDEHTEEEETEQSQ